MIDRLDDFVGAFAAGMLAFLMIPLAMAFWRMVRGPGFADRFIAVDMLTGIAVAIAALTALITQRREFLDVAMGLSLIAFVATCAFAAFLEKKH